MTTIFILFPGLLAFGICKGLSRTKSLPINEIIVDLITQTIFVLLVFYLATKFTFLRVPQLSDVYIAITHLNKFSDIELFHQAIEVCEKTLCALVISAVFVALTTVLLQEYNVIQKLGRPLGIFQNDQRASAWKTTVENGAYNSVVNLDTKSGIRYVGLCHSISWEYEGGGISLRKVKFFDKDQNKLIDVAEFLYVPTSELQGPILFTKPTAKNNEKGE